MRAHRAAMSSTHFARFAKRMPCLLPLTKSISSPQLIACSKSLAVTV
jgi:hypothetical protein